MYLFFDTETTGLPSNWKAPITDLNNWPRLVQLAYVVYDSNGRKIKEEDFIIKPEGFTIPSDISDIHGITTEIALKEGKSLLDVLRQFNLLINQSEILVAHNMNFDEKILGAEFLRLAIQNSISTKKKICTMESSKDFCAIPGPYGNKWPKLSELYYKLFNTTFEEAHNALVDIRATSECFWELVKMKVIEIPDYTEEVIKDILDLINNTEKESDTAVFSAITDKTLLSNNYSTLMKLGDESLSLGNNYAALNYFNRALNYCLDLKVFQLCNIYSSIGQAYFYLEEYNNAETAFNKSIEIFSNFSTSHEFLAITYFRMRDYDKFFKTSEFISMNFPISSKIWYYLAQAHEIFGHYSTARIAYQNAINGGMKECVPELKKLLKKINNHENM